MRRPARPRVPSVVLVLAVGAGGLAAAPAVAAPEVPALVVTEIAPDNTGYDDYEFIERRPGKPKPPRGPGRA